jgi:hypothetical protein
MCSSTKPVLHRRLRHVAGRNDEHPWATLLLDYRVNFAIAAALRETDRLKISPISGIGAAMNVDEAEPAQRDRLNRLPRGRSDFG